MGVKNGGEGVKSIKWENLFLIWKNHNSGYTKKKKLPQFEKKREERIEVILTIHQKKNAKKKT